MKGLRKWGLLLVMMVLAGVPALMAQTEAAKEPSPFHPAETQSVTNITVPVAGNGTVVLNVLVAETGKVQKVEVRRDIPSLTPLAVQAVKDWKFSPAKVGDNAIASRMPVAVTFRPPGIAAPVPLPPLVPQSEDAIQAEFQPAEVTRTAFPRYPDTTVVAGAVVLELTLNAKGEAEEGVKVLRDLPPLTDEAKAVIADFRFIAATLNGHPVESKIVLAFVSQPLSTPLSMNFGASKDWIRSRGR